jgi:hypothetical protein
LFYNKIKGELKMKIYGKITEKRCQQIWDTAYALAFVIEKNKCHRLDRSVYHAAMRADDAVDQLLKLDKEL